MKFRVYVSTEVHTCFELETEAENPVQAEREAKEEAMKLAKECVTKGGAGYQYIANIERID